MSTELQPRRSIPVGTFLLLAISGALYVATLASITFSSGGGEAAFSQALQGFFATTALWIALAVLFVACAIMGNMPRPAGIAAIFILPLAGVATFVAMDMCSRRIAWAVIFPIVLPLLIGFYAVWARFPKLHARCPAKNMSFSTLGLALVLSIVALIAAAI